PPAQKTTHLAIFAKAKRMEEQGRRIIHMEVGEPDYSPPSAVGTALSSAFARGQYHYTDTYGISRLRTAIATRERVKESNVIVTPGGRFGVFAAITSLLRPGDEILIIEPAWPAYRESAAWASASARTLQTRLDDGWLPRMDEIEANLTPSTKMIA